MRKMVKRALELGLCRMGVVALARRLRRHDVLVLAYHNVIASVGEAARGDRSLHITQDRLHEQLGRLSRTHQFIPLDEVYGPTAGRARVAVTFDDAYLGAIRLGAAVLAELRIPATIFVAPGRLGGQHFWWDRLGWNGPLDPRFRERALTDLKGKERFVLNAASIPPSDEPLPVEYATATAEELDAVLGMDGMALGSHSWSHPNLAELEAGELEEELGRPRAWLHDRYGDRVVDWLSYPYGRWSPSVVEAARRAGYRGGLRIEGGRVSAGADPFLTPRVNVPSGLSVDGLELRCAGLMAS
jgi:peptidoglycan/xylan/chitin deacetylase (PgdA/CDA1 family)